MNRYHQRFWMVSITVVSWLAVPHLVAQSQVVEDGTLGTQVTTRGPSNLIFLIQGGTRVGDNLFHSFAQFSIPTNGQANFQNDTNVANIFARVTGNKQSEIFGRIAAQGSANLFLMNPNGILFGSGARLQIGGSFIATTANAILFNSEGAEGRFSAEINSSDKLLTVNPSALLINQLSTQSPSTIRVNAGAILRVPTSQNLVLAGGNINLNGGMLLAREGRIDLGAVANGTVGLTPNTLQRFQLDIPTSVPRAAVGIAGATLNVEPPDDAENGNGGVIRIDGQDISSSSLDKTVTQFFARGVGEGRGGKVELIASNNVSLANTNVQSDGIKPQDSLKGADAGNISIFAKGSISLTKGTLLTSDTYGSGQGGNIQLDSQSIQMSNGAALRAKTRGSGPAGTISLHADDTIQFESGAVISTTSDSGTTGNGGLIDIQANSLALTGKSTLAAATSGQGAAGNINIKVNSLTLTDGSTLTTATFDKGKAGNIIINAGNKGNVAISDSFITTAAEPLVAGDLETDSKGGDIGIQAGNILLKDGVISASTRGTGNAGNINLVATTINIVAEKPVQGFVAPGVFTSTTASGSAGNLTIQAEQLKVQGGARISASTSGSGQGGSLTISMKDLVELVGSLKDGQPSGLFAITAPGSTGNGGSIFVNSNAILIQDRATIAVGSQGSGRGGDIQIQANTTTLQDRGSISATTANAQGGDITLQVRDLLLLRNQSSISTTAGTVQAQGNGGNITIIAPKGFIVSAPNENNDITANAFTGSGGIINIYAKGTFWFTTRSRAELQRLLGMDPEKLNPASLPTNDITAISQVNPNLNGIVNITTPDVDPNRGLSELPANLVDASNQIAQGCGPNNQRAASSFTVTGKGGLPSSPMETLGNEAVTTEWVSVEGVQQRRGDVGIDKVRNVKSSESAISNPQSSVPTSPIIEAQSWIVDANGEVVLTAQTPNAQSQASSFPTATCSSVNR
jgi:filamentous hemagglutinin family protein